MTDDSSTPSFSGGRKFGAGLHVLLSSLLLVAVIAMVNYISARHFKRYYLPSDTSNQLSPSTHLVLRSLTNEVRVTVLFDPEEDLYSAVASLLKEYGYASPKLKIEHVDYRVEAEKAGRIKAEYRLTDDQKNLIIFSCNGKPKFITQGELSEYDFSKLMSGTSNEIKRKAFHGERLFTSAILTVSDPTPAKVYFLFGHGEHNPRDTSNDHDYGKFATLLQEGSMQLGGLSLLGTNEVPADCQMLVMAGPKTKVSQAEQEKLDRYLNQGGRLLLLVPSRSSADLENLLARWGVALGDNQVMERGNGSQPDDFLVLKNFGSHPVTKAFRPEIPMLLFAPRSVGRGGPSAPGADAPQVAELGLTTDKGIAITDYKNGLRPNLTRDRQGEVPVMVAVEKGSLKGVNVDRGATRMIVVGDSYFLDNTRIENGSNRDFAWHAANWLLDRSQLLGGIGPRPVTEIRLTIPKDQMERIWWMLLGVVPGTVMLFGMIVWMRRRR